MRRRRHLRRARIAAVISTLGLTGATVVIGLALLLIIDQTFRAPDWLRERVATRLEANLGGMQMQFGDVSIVISEGWRPRAALRDVQLSDADGRPVLRLSDARASLAMRPLLRGEVQPKQITLSGAFAVLRRDADGAVSLAFDGASGPVEEAETFLDLLGGLDAAFANPQLAALIGVDLEQLNLRYEDAMTGRAWTVDSGQMRLTRAGDALRLSANLALLTGRDFASEVEVNFDTTIGESSAAFGVSLTDVPARDIASQSLALSWLTPLRAPMSGALRGSVDADGTIGPINATLQIGAGALQPTDETAPIPFEAAQAYFTFFPQTNALRFDEITVQSDWVTGSADGTMYLDGIEDGQLTGLTGQMELTRTELNPAGLYDAPVALSRALADFQLDLDPFTLALGQAVIVDGDTTLRASGVARAEPEGWALSLDGELDALTPERLVTLWPEAAAPRARQWIARNLTGGVLTDLSLALRLAPNQRPDVYLDFDYADTSVRFMRSMPQMTGVSGHASFVGNRFVTTASRGQILADTGGAVDVAGTSFILPDVTARPGTPAIVRARGEGTLTAVLSLLNRDPMNVMARANLPVDLGAGRVAFSGSVALPLKPRVPFEEVEFFVDGIADGVRSEVLIPNRVLEADSLRIAAQTDMVTISGTARLDGVETTARWQQPLGQPGEGSTVEGTLPLSAEVLETFGVALPAGMVAGEGRATLALRLPQGAAPRLTLNSDLEGLALAIPQLGWRKPAATPGALSLEATLGAEARADELRLSAPGFSAVGSVTPAPGGGLGTARFSELRRDTWMSVSAQLEGRGVGQAPAIRVLGGTLDMRRATFGGGSSSGGAPLGRDALTARLDLLRITDTIALSDFQGAFALSGGLSGEFAARVNGGTAVRGTVVPDAGRSAVRVLSEDAGGVFRDAGLLEQAREGAFDMTLRPVGDPGTFDGVLQVEDVFVRDAPAIAALLNAISIVGLVNELAGQGILFSDVMARFQLTPSALTLREGRATGASMGLTMDGTYDVVTRRLNMQGVISPVYLLNQIGGILAPRRGEGLFGFTYRLSGLAQSPTVQVNPLSALAPGVFRDLFRARPPGSEDAEVVRRPPVLSGEER